MTVKKNYLFHFKLPKNENTFVHRRQKLNLEGNIHPALPFILFFDDMIIKGTKERTYLML